MIRMYHRFLAMLTAILNFPGHRSNIYTVGLDDSVLANLRIEGIAHCLRDNSRPNDIATVLESQVDDYVFETCRTDLDFKMCVKFPYECYSTREVGSLECVIHIQQDGQPGVVDVKWANHGIFSENCAGQFK